MASYGGYLRFTLEFTADEDGGRPYRDVDVEIIVRLLCFYENTIELCIDMFYSLMP